MPTFLIGERSQLGDFSKDEILITMCGLYACMETDTDEREQIRRLVFSQSTLGIAIIFLLLWTRVDKFSRANMRHSFFPLHFNSPCFSSVSGNPAALRRPGYTLARCALLMLRTPKETSESASPRPVAETFSRNQDSEELLYAPTHCWTAF